MRRGRNRGKWRRKRVRSRGKVRGKKIEERLGEPGEFKGVNYREAMTENRRGRKRRVGGKG